MTLEQALARLSDPAFNLSELRTIVGELSVSARADADIFVFYSGGYLPDVSAHDAALSLAQQSSRIALIDQTDVSKFLSDPFVQERILTLVGNQDAYNRLLFEDTDALWRVASANFAKTASGNVIVLASEGLTNPDGVWRATEFYEVLRNTNVDSINGISRSTLLDFVMNPDTNTF